MVLQSILGPVTLRQTSSSTWSSFWVLFGFSLNCTFLPCLGPCHLSFLLSNQKYGALLYVKLLHGMTYDFVVLSYYIPSGKREQKWMTSDKHQQNFNAWGKKKTTKKNKHTLLSPQLKYKENYRIRLNFKFLQNINWFLIWLTLEREPQKKLWSFWGNRNFYFKWNLQFFLQNIIPWTYQHELLSSYAQKSWPSQSHRWKKDKKLFLHDAWMNFIHFVLLWQYTLGNIYNPKSGCWLF